MNMEIKKILLISIVTLGGLFSQVVAQNLLSCENPQIMKSGLDCTKTGKIDVSSFKYQGKNIVYTGIECVKLREAIALLENVEVDKINITSTNDHPFIEIKIDIAANSVEKRPTDCEQKILKKLIEVFDIKYEIIDW